MPPARWESIFSNRVADLINFSGIYHFEKLSVYSNHIESFFSKVIFNAIRSISHLDFKRCVCGENAFKMCQCISFKRALYCVSVIVLHVQNDVHKLVNIGRLLKCWHTSAFHDRLILNFIIIIIAKCLCQYYIIA